jgi:Ca2+-binding EF-hand superfamily protein
MWRLALLASAVTVVPSLSLAQQPCTADPAQVIEQVYRQVLERSADPGASVWVDRLSRGTTVREIVRGIAQSPEHLQRFGSQSREGMVVDVYRHLLNRGPDPEGMKNAGVFVTMRGSASLVDQLVDSPEYRERFGDWTVPGSSVRYCAGGDRGGEQVSSAVLRGRNRVGDGRDEDTVAKNRFDYLDINGNGYIDRREWDGAQNAFRRLDVNDDRRLSRGEFTGGERDEDSFASIDRDRDGRIRLNEWPWSRPAFDRQDANRDGVITQNEYRGVAAIRR